MRLIQVVINNFMIFGSDVVWDVPESGAVLVRGQRDDSGSSNEAGKSTLLEAVYWNITGDTVRKAPAAKFVNLKKKFTSVTCQYEVNEEIIEVVRYWSPTQKYVRVINKTTNTETNFHDSAQGTKYVLEKFGLDAELLALVCFFGRKFVTFSRLERAQRAALIDRLAEGEKWEKAATLATKKARTEKVRVQELQDTLQKELENKKDTEEQLNEQRKRRKERKAEIADTVKSITIQKDEVDEEVKEEKAKEAAAVKETKGIVTRLEELLEKKMKISLPVLHYEEKKIATAEFLKVTKEFERVGVQQATLNKKLTELAELPENFLCVDTIQEVDRNITKLTEEVNALGSALLEVRNELTSNGKKQVVVTKELLSLAGERKVVKAELLHVEKDELDVESELERCPWCNSLLEEKNRLFLQKRQEELTVQKEELLTRQRGIKSKIRKGERAQEDLVEQDRKLNTEYTELEERQKDMFHELQNMELSRERIVTQTELRDVLGSYENLQRQKKGLEVKIKKYETLEEERREQAEALDADITSVLERKEKAHTVAFAAAKRITELVEKLGTLQENLLQLQNDSTLKKITLEIAQLAGKLEAYTVAVEEKKEKLLKAKRRLGYYLYWSVGFKSIRFSRMETITKLLENYVTAYALQLGLQCKRVTIKPFTETKKVRPEVTLSIETANGELPLGLLSEGATQKIDLACFLAIGQLLHVVKGITFDFRVMDEPLAGLDAPSKARAFELIEQLPIQQKFVIDHDAHFQDRFEMITSVVHSGGYSSIL